MDDDGPKIRYEWRQETIRVGRDIAFYVDFVFRLVLALPFIITLGVAALLSWLSDQVFGSM